MSSFYCGFSGGGSLARKKESQRVSGTVAWPVETQSSNSSVCVWVWESVCVCKGEMAEMGSRGTVRPFTC